MLHLDSASNELNYNSIRHYFLFVDVEEVHYDRRGIHNDWHFIFNPLIIFIYTNTTSSQNFKSP